MNGKHLGEIVILEAKFLLHQTCSVTVNQTASITLNHNAAVHKYLFIGSFTYHGNPMG